MYASSKDPNASLAHFGEVLNNQGIGDEAVNRLREELRQLAGRKLSALETAKALIGFDRWMHAIPDDVDSATHGRQFIDEFAGSGFSYIPEPYTIMTPSGVAAEKGENQERVKFDAKAHFRNVGFDPTDLDLTLEEFAKKHNVDVKHLEDLRPYEV